MINARQFVNKIVSNVVWLFSYKTWQNNFVSSSVLGLNLKYVKRFLLPISLLIRSVRKMYLYIKKWTISLMLSRYSWVVWWKENSVLVSWILETSWQLDPSPWTAIVAGEPQLLEPTSMGTGVVGVIGDATWTGVTGGCRTLWPYPPFMSAWNSWSVGLVYPWWRNSSGMEFWLDVYSSPEISK